MRIDRVEIFHLGLPLRQPHKTKAGLQKTLQTVLVRMDSGPTSGWGEASPGSGPLAGPEWAHAAFICIRDWLAPQLVGNPVDSGKDLQQRLALVQGNQFAKGALDAAWWDLTARRDGQPLHQTLDGQHPRIEVGVAFDQMETIDELLEAMGLAFQAGYARVDLKMRPGWDLHVLNAVRHEFPTETVHTDVEAGMTLNEMEILYRLDDFALAMVEQPLPADDLVGHAMVQDAIRTPVCLDEGITTLQQAEIALELKSCQYVNLKPGRVGGLTVASAIHDLCQAEKIPCFVGAMPQSAVGARAGFALASKPNFRYPADYLAPTQLLQKDLAETPPPSREGDDGPLCIPLWKEPGIGIEPDPKALDQFTLHRQTIE